MTTAPVPVAAPRPGRRNRTGGPVDVLRLARRTSTGAVATVVVLWTAADASFGVPTQLVAVVAVVGLLLGLPHGAVDHVVLRLGGATTRPRTIALQVAAYVALAVVAWLAFRAAPAPSLVAFLLLSAAHFGAGETAFLRLRGVPAPRTHWVATGLVVVVLPLSLHPSAVAPYLALLVPGWSGRVDPTVSLAGTVAVLGVALASALAAVRAGQWAPARELVLLTALSVLLPPVVAIAVYFGTWHAVRHTSLLVHDETRLTGPGAVRRLMVRGAGPTAAALAVLALLWWGLAGGQLDRFVTEQVGLLAALTVPHAAVVWWSERRRTPVEA